MTLKSLQSFSNGNSKGFAYNEKKQSMIVCLQFNSNFRQKNRLNQSELHFPCDQPSEKITITEPKSMTIISSDFISKATTSAKNKSPYLEAKSGFTQAYA